MKIIKIAEDNPFRNEGVDPLESPLRDNFEAEQNFQEEQKDEYSKVVSYIGKLKESLFDLQHKIVLMEEEQEHAEKTNNWTYFKDKGII